MNKSKLKEGYYYEEKEWYDACPDDLPNAPKYQIEIFPKVMTHKEILETYKIVPYSSYREAAAVVVSIIPTLKNDFKSRLVYFKENEVLYRFSAWRRGGGRLYLYVREVELGNEYGAGSGACFLSNSTSDTSGDSPLDSLTLPQAIKICKENGYKVMKEM